MKQNKEKWKSQTEGMKDNTFPKPIEFINAKEYLLN